LVTFINDIFEENLWRGFLTSQLDKLQLGDLKLYLIVGVVWGLWHLPYYLVFLPEATMRAVLPVNRATFAAVSVVTMMCWAVMFIELFRVTKSLWPCILLHAVEDALVNPLILSGFITIAAGKEILVSPIVGVIPSLLYVAVGLGIRTYRIRANRLAIGPGSLPA
jgi:membrane protease YdiL (CAAX protease family)